MGGVDVGQRDSDWTVVLTDGAALVDQYKGLGCRRIALAFCGFFPLGFKAEKRRKDNAIIVLTSSLTYTDGISGDGEFESFKRKSSKQVVL